MPPVVHVRPSHFFASVEQALRPRLRGRPVIVGSVRVLSASQEAAFLGVSEGMAVAEALRLCPGATVLEPRFERYAKGAEQIGQILRGFVNAVDPDAAHGFYLNFFASAALESGFEGLLQRIQMDVLRETGVAVSIGAGGSRVLASVASHVDRPNGIRVIRAGGEPQFLWNLPVEALNGVVKFNPAEIRRRGIATLGELSRVPEPKLSSVFGERMGRSIWRCARGLDPKSSVNSILSRSVVREMSVQPVTGNPSLYRGIVGYLSARIIESLAESSQQLASVGIRLEYQNQAAVSHSVALPAPATTCHEISTHAQNLLAKTELPAAAVTSVAVFASIRAVSSIRIPAASDALAVNA
jgi:DNA polymerase-4